MKTESGAVFCFNGVRMRARMHSRWANLGIRSSGRLSREAQTVGGPLFTKGPVKQNPCPFHCTCKTGLCDMVEKMCQIMRTSFKSSSRRKCIDKFVARLSLVTRDMPGQDWDAKACRHKSGEAPQQADLSWTHLTLPFTIHLLAYSQRIISKPNFTWCDLSEQNDLEKIVCKFNRNHGSSDFCII